MRETLQVYGNPLTGVRRDDLEWHGRRRVLVLKLLSSEWYRSELYQSGVFSFANTLHETFDDVITFTYHIDLAHLNFPRFVPVSNALAI